jgi:hypothetical protein
MLGDRGRGPTNAKTARRGIGRPSHSRSKVQVKCNAPRAGVTTGTHNRQPLLVTWAPASGTYHRLDCPGLPPGPRPGWCCGTISQARPRRRPHHCLTRQSRNLKPAATRTIKTPAACRQSFVWSRLREVYHLPACPWARRIAKENRASGARRTAEGCGRRACQRCLRGA